MGDASPMGCSRRSSDGGENSDLAYRQPGPKLLTVEGTFDGHKIQARLSRDETQFLLTTRGFHWINEFPFNR